jgi:adenylate cyclase
VLASHAVDDRGEGSSVSPVAVMFTDLQGFTRFTSDHGDDAALALLDDHHKAVGPVVRSRGGRVVKRLGDGLMLAFVSPEAAALAAVELVALRPEPLCLRVGVHLGEAVLTRDDLVGHVVNVAARITEAAKGGQALATVDVRDAVGTLPGVHFARARRMRLKGVPDPMLVCRVEAAP